VNDIALSQLYDDSKSAQRGALTIPGYSADGCSAHLQRRRLLDAEKPIGSSQEGLHDLLHKEPT